MDDALLQSLGDEAVGVVSAAWYSADLDTPSNKRFVAAMQKDYQRAARRLLRRHVHRRPMRRGGDRRQLGGKADDRKALAEALHKVSLADTPRGPVKFDHFGNVVGDVFIRSCERKDGTARQHRDQDLSQREPVLDLRREGVPGEPGLRARRPAGEELGDRRRAPRYARISLLSSPGSTGRSSNHGAAIWA